MVGGGYLFCCVPVVAIASPHGPGDGMQLGLVPCMPFLLAWPQVTSFVLAQERNLSGNFGGFIAAYLVGTIGYAIAALVMTAVTIERFDEKSGRMQRRPGWMPRPGPWVDPRLPGEDQVRPQPPPETD